MQLIHKLRQITVVRYLFVGCSSFVVELSSLLFLFHVAHFSLAAATATAYWIGLVVAFVLQKLFAFQDYNRELKALSRQGFYFGLLAVWNWLFTITFVTTFGSKNVIISRSVAIVIMSGWNYFIYKNVLFKSADHKPKARKVMRWWERVLHDPLLRVSLLVVAMWRIVLELWNQVLGHWLQRQPDLSANVLQWRHWDGDWYMSIIREGYAPVDPDWHINVAFFPAYPQIVRVVSNIVHVDPLYVGLVLNIFLTVAVVYLLMKLAALIAARNGLSLTRSKQVAIMSAVALLAYPASFFMAAFYADALLVLGFVGAIYMALTKRLLLAVPFMIAASASKITGSVAVVTVGVIVLEQWWQERGSLWQLSKRWAIAGLGVLGLAAYMLYSWMRFGSPLFFYYAEKAWGRADGGFFVKRIAAYYLHMFEPGYYGSWYNYAMMLFMMILPFLVLGAGLFIARRYKTYWPLVLGFFTILLPLSTGIIDSLNRYCLVAIPLVPFIVTWLLGKIRPAWLYAVLGLSAISMLVFAVGFLDGRWFAG
ncbi:MAG TPA: GtrA family protein [Candidatus Saccharimonadales bacterium]|nr:GtrA family protein [Candidatus Saccharimonadales bacterium]